VPAIGDIRKLINISGPPITPILSRFRISEGRLGENAALVLRRWTELFLHVTFIGSGNWICQLVVS
jgi:hypothetical protein